MKKLTYKRALMWSCGYLLGASIPWLYVLFTDFSWFQFFGAGVFHILVWMLLALAVQTVENRRRI